MQTKITQFGNLTISPDTELEAFALEAWFRDYNNNNGNCTLVIESLDRVTSLIAPNKEKYTVVSTRVTTASGDKKVVAHKTSSRQRENADVVILKLLSSNLGGLLATEIESKTKLKEKTVYNALNKLFKAKKIDKDKSGKFITWRTGTGKLIEAKKPEFKDTHKPFKDYRN